MKDLIIMGAGGFAKEVAWLVERINSVSPTWNLLGFTDVDEARWGDTLKGKRILGNDSCIKNYPGAYAVCAIGAARVRRRSVEQLLRVYPEVRFAVLVDPSAIVSDSAALGDGTIVCAGAILTVDISIGRHCIIDTASTVGHDAVIHDFVTLYPSVNISGSTDIGECSEIGTGSQMIQGKRVGKSTIVGAGSVIIRDLPDNCTAVGVPAKPIKFFE